MTPKKTLIAVVGPTASGKTDLAIQLARFYETEIISFDSRQTYQELNIGVARPTETELNTVKHHLIASASIHQPYTAASFALDFNEKLEQIFSQNHIAVAVGGTGLYLKAALGELDDIPTISAEIRLKVSLMLETEGLESLQKLLKVIDPEAFEIIELENPRRITKALEVYYQSRKKYSSFLQKKYGTPSYRIIQVGIDFPREVLYQRINARVDAMMQAGLLKEVEGLYNFKQLNALQTVGYSELFDYLDGKCDLNFAIEKIKQHTRNYAKRQITWWKKTDTKFFDYQFPNAVLPYVNEWLKDTGN